MSNELQIIDEAVIAIEVKAEINEDIDRIIDDQPTVNLSARTEIIVCADCKHWICHDRRCGYWNHGVKPLEWCCHAERREK